MAVWEKFKIGFCFLLIVVTICTTFNAVVGLMIFLSDPHYKLHTWNKDWVKTSWSLFINQLLLVMFIVQHSLLALPTVKNRMLSSNLKVFQRCIYIILTSVSLQILLKYWHPIPEVVLWSINTNVRFYWWSFLLLHTFAWILIYIGTICLDVNELLGIKQVYYNIRQLPDPSEYKSPDLKRLYLHMRHPSFIGFVVILWFIPFMSLDRFVLALILSAYMYLGWNTDSADHKYQELQSRRKFYELNYLK
ncbi:hypothetical protein PPYR_14451 [Photinus pyralis]|uniref:Nuclear envelope membrane protein n=1 Tax=Photinus pyralis TaxID=7054 RepID=A0A1Y1MZL9_PHOPY|nr:nurim homolog [Photinus pyralis]KAB0792492.1 hypothetical protein PPYR_14451 [Photinus pyralis]